MADLTETPETKNPEKDKPSSTQWIADMLKSDIKGIANQALYNAAFLYPFYLYRGDEYVFKSGEGDVATSLKLAGIVGVLNESTKMTRQGIAKAGYDKLAYPFGK
jgi:hypothetical protein